MSIKTDTAEVSEHEHVQVHRTISDADLIGTHSFSKKRLWNREPLDEFYKEALEKYPTEESIDPAQEIRVRKKIDRLIIPCLAVCYAFYYIDKTTLSYAAIFGIKTDLKLEGTEYSWLSSIFYFGWLAWGIPSNLLMQRSPSGKYLAINIFMWGVLLMAQAASRNFTDLAVLRILSGAFEAIADPAFMLITTMFYRRSEQPSRISMWYAANGVGVAGGGLLGYGIGQIKGSLPSWKYEFLIVGALCATWGIVLFFILPDSPATASTFTREDRLLAVARLRENQTGVDNKQFKWDQFRETFVDPKTWLFFLLGLVGNIPNGGISNASPQSLRRFSTLIIQGLGFDTLQTTLLGIPQGALVCIWIGLGLYPLHAPYYRWYTSASSSHRQEAHAGRLICYYLTGSYQASFVLGLSIITSNTAGQTKKQLTSALIWLGACVGNISGPFFYLTDQAPTYRLGIGSMLVSNCIEVLIFIALRFYLIRLNRKRDNATTTPSTSTNLPESAGSTIKLNPRHPNENETAFSDMTDIQNVNFRYVY
ncbi:MFS general substrate transporter [Gymnopus androsaceus JB14]|uniref:MFS general substrate transporter n=1 Tax=Gymnopus androsaceus JB14 TaxID=1447944 RepID=A0A6A4HXA0_9AGAR|nr:MFS general substrate transporter [Gymnopus androsaceus JB14]